MTRAASLTAETPAMTLDMQSVANAFINMQALIGRMQGISGILLAHIMHHAPKGPNNAALTARLMTVPCLANRVVPMYQLTMRL
jgi:hypothetical protein